MENNTNSPREPDRRSGCPSEVQVFARDLWQEHFGRRTIDSFRPRFTNALLLLEEIDAYLDVLQSDPRASADNLYSLAAEGKMVLGRDPALSLADSHIRDSILTFLRQLSSEKGRPALSVVPHALNAFLPQLRELYGTPLRAHYYEAVASQDKNTTNDTLERVTRSFYSLASLWLAQGHTVEYLSGLVEVVGTSECPTFLDLAKLTRISSASTPKYICTTNIRSPRHDHAALRSLGEMNDAIITPNEDGTLQIKSTVSSPDSHRACELFESIVSSVLDQLQLVSPNEPVGPRSTINIIDAETGARQPAASARKFAEPRHAAHITDEATRIRDLPGILKNASSRARQQLRGALRHHRLALHADSFESQYLNLWIGLEFLVRQRDTSVINSVLTSVPKILALRNARKYIMFFHDQLLRLSGARKDRPPIDEARLAWIDLLDTLRGIRGNMSDLLGSLSDYPLLRYRIEKFAARVRKPLHLSQFISSHHQMVSWHVKRLYRARNGIVHTGILPRGGFFLLRNLHDYLYVSIKHFARALHRANHLTDLEEVTFRTHLAYELLLNRLAGKDSTPSRDILFPRYYDQAPA